MKKYIFLDTNNWIYLSNGFNVLSNKHDELHLKIFEIIQRRAEEGLLIFLINEIVVEEWKRNKSSTEQQIKDLNNKYKSYSEALGSVRNFIGEESDEMLGPLGIKMEQAFKRKITHLQKHIVDVEDFLLNKTQRIPISNNVKIEATDLALERKAPFIGDKKNSMADALILLSAIEYLKENHRLALPAELMDDGIEAVFYPKSYFVSSNKGDFSSPADKEIIHPDLAPKLAETKTSFYYTLGKLINSFEDEFLTFDEQRAIEFADDRFYCDQCESDYYPSVHFSEEFYVPDSGKSVEHLNQIRINFDNYGTDLYKPEDFLTAIRTASCANCAAEYVECPCGNVNYVEVYNEKIRCEGECGRVFIAHAEMDRKGSVLSVDYEILHDKECQGCGIFFEKLSDSDLCSECEDGYAYV
ncbi:MAG: hypothetical protein DI539_17895 [Flavobacterium psychrophilum]|nr:MAG: hypothetical protein DI539_17895 [Flavobacterium psychrophilum]